MKSPSQRRGRRANPAPYKAFTEVASFRGPNFYAWLYSIARNLCINYLHHRIREDVKIKEGILHAASGFVSVGKSPEEWIIQAEEVVSVLNQLDARQRICLKLCYGEGYSYQEIGAITGYSDQEIKSYIQNGRSRFQSLWEKRSR